MFVIFLYIFQLNMKYNTFSGMNISQEKIVRAPAVPNTTRDTDNSIFNSVGFYSSLQDSLEDQKQKLLSIMVKLKNSELGQNEN
jgi:hypothetical protein